MSGGARDQPGRSAAAAGLVSAAPHPVGGGAVRRRDAAPLDADIAVRSA